jgi:hypothetical protein
MYIVYRYTKFCASLCTDSEGRYLQIKIPLTNVQDYATDNPSIAWHYLLNPV